MARLFSVLYQHVEGSKLGEVFFAPLDVVLSPQDVVQPDLVFLSSGRRQRLTPKNIQGAPDLVVEVISDASRRLDKKLKRALYSRYDVLECWLFDPELRMAEIYRRDAENRLVLSPLLPGFNLDIATLWPQDET